MEAITPLLHCSSPILGDIGNANPKFSDAKVLEPLLAAGISKSLMYMQVRRYTVTPPRPPCSRAPSVIYTSSSADADKPARRVYTGYGFLLVFLSNCVPKMHRFQLFDFKNAVTFKTGLGVRQGHCKCHRSIERIRLPIDVL